MARNRKPSTGKRSPGPKPGNHSKSRAGQLRIIAGLWRGRVLKFPGLDGLRPTGDRVRETLFNWLQGDIHQARCLDLFAGSGALGLEALSRGASHCTFIDSQTSAYRSLVDNLNLLQCDAGKVVQGNALNWLQHHSANLESTFDIVFCDPPFSADLWSQTLTLLAGHPSLAPNAFIYIESPRGTQIEPPLGWQLMRSKDTGQIRFCLFQATG